MSGKTIFNSVKMTRPNRNSFDLSHDVKMSCRMGNLNPTMLLECIPGDKFNIGCDSLVRLAPLVAPVMHRMDVTMHYFFVPHRILWENWEKYITNTSDPITGILPAFPTVQIDGGNTQNQSLADYFGLPTLNAMGYNVSALPFAAYQKIYNEYYRDQNLCPEIDSALIDGDNSSNLELFNLRRRAWEHDYFTSSLPFAQKGAAVDIPLGNVELNPDTEGVTPGLWKKYDIYNPINTGQLPQDGGIQISTGTWPAGTYDAGGIVPITYDPNGTLQVEPTTINDLRRAFKLQEWLEKSARGGSRYIENILAFFGVKSSDARLQRPEYITGVKSPIIVSEVLQTGETNTTPQGNMAGHSVSVNQGDYGDYYCEEHGYILGIMSILPKTAYMQGIEKTWLKTTSPFDFFWPQFANIGEQEVLVKEIYAESATPNATFGYVPRYAEYKFMNNRVAGDFRTTLNFWHMARDFGGTPTLSQQFIECDPTDRIFAVNTTDDNVYCQILHKIRASRLMPIYGTPTF